MSTARPTWPAKESSSCRPREVEGESRLDWAVASDRELTFTWRSTTEADYEGVPAEAYQRVLYTAVPFTPST